MRKQHTIWHDFAIFIKTEEDNKTTFRLAKSFCSQAVRVSLSTLLDNAGFD